MKKSTNFKQLVHLLLAIVVYMSIARGTTYAQGNALHFDGTNDVVDMGAFASTFEGVQHYTVEAWLNYDQLTGGGTIFSKRTSDTNRDLVIQNAGGGTLYIMVSNGYGQTTNPLVAGTWYHIAGVYDGTGATNADKLKLYINGVQESLTFSGTVPATTPVIAGSRFALGSEYSGSVPISGGGVCCGFKGKVDNLRVWSTSRTASEIADNMNATTPGSSLGLVANYLFNQGTAGGNNAGVTTLNAEGEAPIATLWNFALNGGTSNWVTYTTSYTLNITSTHGTVTKDPDQANYSSGSVVQLTATPEKGYLFSSWSGDATGSANPLSVTMSANKSITANYTLDPVYQTMYRTAKYEDWATSVDLKGKRAAAKRKFDKNFFEFTIVADTVRPLKLDFGMKVTALISRNEVEDDTVLVVTNLSKITDSLLSVMPGETLLVAGTGTMGKKLAAKYSWGKKKAVSLKADSLYDQNIKGLPMPNLVNVGEELFPKGFGNTVSYYPKTGLVLGIPQGTKKANSMVLKKYGDVLTTLAKKVKTGYIFDTANVRCLDTLKKKPIAKQIGATGPDKYQNKFLAEALTFKLNIAASVTSKFPAGLGELTYNNSTDPTNPFNNMIVSAIAPYADSMLSCLPLSSKPTATMSELFAVMHNINIAFADSPYTIDTASFGTKTQLAGLKKLLDVSYLLPTTGVAATIFEDKSNYSNETPEVFALNQNYPNPFNPTTQLSFVLGNSSMVTLKVYDILGKEVATLLNNENVEGGAHEVTFNAGNFASGVYFYRLTTQSVDGNGMQQTFTDVKRMMLIK